MFILTANLLFYQRAPYYTGEIEMLIGNTNLLIVDSINVIGEV